MPGPQPSFADTPTSPFLDQQGKGYYAPDYITASGQNADGASRGVVIGQAVQDLLNRQGPNFQGASTADIERARAQQQGALGLMRNFAMGNGPSVARAQTYGALGQNIAAMNAASQGHGGVANAMTQGYGAGNQTAMQGAGARAAEQASLMGAYGAGTNALRNADVSQYGIAQENLARGNQLATQQGILNAQTGFGLEQQEEQNEINNQAYMNALTEQAKQKQQQKNQENIQMVGGTLEMAAGLMSGNAGAAVQGGEQAVQGATAEESNASDIRKKTEIRGGLMGEGSRGSY